jgi:hypothetical protein
MNQDIHNIAQELKLDRNQLYREETFTDTRVGAIKRLTPVRSDGSVDDRRPTIFVGQTQVLSQVGPVPIHCTIEARTLDEALENFPAAIEKALADLMDQARELQHREASRIISPAEVGAMPGLGDQFKP